VEAKSWIIKSVSFERSEVVTKLLDDVQKRMQIDGWGFSRIVYEALAEYLQHHPLPNPQSQIDRMLMVGMPHKATNQCCVVGCRGKVRMVLQLKNYEGKTEAFPVCLNHEGWRHKEFRFLVGTKKVGDACKKE
jgi:hypothetical protein